MRLNASRFCAMGTPNEECCGRPSEPFLVLVQAQRTPPRTAIVTSDCSAHVEFFRDVYLERNIFQPPQLLQIFALSTDAGLLRFKEISMSKDAHSKAAEHHENAAKAHRNAAFRMILRFLRMLACLRVPGSVNENPHKKGAS
jgi:hypothetical protein